MKVKNLSHKTFLLFILISSVFSLSTIIEYILHDEHELPIVCPLEDDGVLAISEFRGSKQEVKISRLDKDARPVYNNKTKSFRYSSSAQLVKHKKSDKYGLFYHESSYEKYSTFEDEGNNFSKGYSKNSVYLTESAVALKNGKIFLAGIYELSTKYAETNIELQLYDPERDVMENGLSFASHGNFISCYEQKENNVYCVYVSYENEFIRKLKIKRILVDDTTLVEKEDKVIKTFYTEFNFLKAIPFKMDEVLILFQVGNNEKVPSVGNTGQDLYFYQLQLSSTEFFTAIRYEFLSQQCNYVKDPADYNADIIALTENRIYAVCEAEENVFKAFEIHPGDKEIIKFDIDLPASRAKTPVLTKFVKTLGVFYNQILSSQNSKVAYFLINYPDCRDYRTKENPALLPKRFKKDIDLSGYVFMSNPFPRNRADEKISYRLSYLQHVQVFNMLIYPGSKFEPVQVEQDKDYEGENHFEFSTDYHEGYYTIPFISTRKDPLDGLILGRTCEIHLNTPKCLPQCYSCTKTGNEEHHYCLGCAEGSYYEEKDDTAENEGYGIPHNCKNCDISCTSCYGPFLSKIKPFPTTNCIKCDYENGYYHYFYDNRTCISYVNQSEWEIALNHSIYLDDSPGEENKDKWRWKHCHDNCKKCHGPGTNEDNQCDECKEDLHFYCNQTIGHGIPGSCHANCVNNGFYLKLNASDNMDKCCPCLDHCKVCQNDTICEECYSPFYKTPEWDRCNKTCNDCLAYDDDLKECVFCKTRYERIGHSPRYHFYKERKCVYPLPNDYHVIDDICYNITICDKSCFTCDPENSAQCTKCAEGYYKEDFFGLEQPKTFRCFSKPQCQGIERYPPEPIHKVGGVPVEENGEKVCLNCRLRNNSYRQPENDFYCGERKRRTYIDIDYYNKLSDCYFRCKECAGYGHACFMNCTYCLDSAYYDLILLDSKNKYGNCYRKAHPCGIYPYYHDYDLAEKLGIEEDNCGEKCDVCLYNFSCTPQFPYFNFETHECVEYCPLTKVLGGQCQLNNSAAFYGVLIDPFGTGDPYAFINRSVSIKEFISGDLWKYFASSYKFDETIIENAINNYLGSGQIFNLPESQIIIGNNISIELTSNRLEQEKIVKIMEGNTTAQTNTSIIDISSCEAIIKKKYGLSDEEELMIIKGDLLENLTEMYIGNKVEYQLFSTSMGCFFPLSDCEEGESSVVSVTNPFNTQNLISQFQSKIDAVVSNGYDVFDSNSPFYNDICSPFTNENGNDVLLDERRADYFNENINLCERGCTFVSYNLSLKMYTCSCPVKTSVGADMKNNSNVEQVSKEFPESFYKRHKHSNIEVFKCASQVFSPKGQTKNFGSYCLLTCMASLIGAVVFYFVKGKDGINLLFRHPASPPNPKNVKNDKKTYNDPSSKRKIEHKPTAVPLGPIIISDEQLNSAPYKVASKEDHRGYLKQYWSLLKMKQLFIFTFYTSKDYNLRVAKISLFILFISFYFAFTALFFNDSIMREIYIYKGNTSAAIHIPNIVLSSLCCIIMNIIVRFVSLNERDIAKINCERNPNDKKILGEKLIKIMKIKLYILFGVSALLITLCWYYVSAFCAVFKNSQGHYFINLLVAFIICNIWPCVTSLIPPIFRKKGLDSGSECMYTFSQIISYI